MTVVKQMRDVTLATPNAKLVEHRIKEDATKQRKEPIKLTPFIKLLDELQIVTDMKPRFKDDFDLTSARKNLLDMLGNQGGAGVGTVKTELQNQIDDLIGDEDSDEQGNSILR